MWVKEECNETREFLVKFIEQFYFFTENARFAKHLINKYFYFQRGPDLRIFNIQPSDAGTYICLVSPDESELTQVGDEDSSSWSSNERIGDSSFLECSTIILKVRSVPGPVSRLSVRLSTILGVLMWEFHSNNSGGYPIKSFTTEFRRYFDILDETNTTAHKWHRLDPENIPANVVRFFGFLF